MKSIIENSTKISKFLFEDSVPVLFGVNVAVYMVLLTAEKLLMVPPDTVMSPDAKFVVASLDVKVNDSVLSLLVSPLLTSAAVIVTVGEVESYVQVN